MPQNKFFRFIQNKYFKYVFVCVVFALIITFAGNQSLVSVVKRGLRVYRLEKQMKQKQEQIDQCQQDIRALHNIDSLERYARERYYMHSDKEDVYLVED